MKLPQNVVSSDDFQTPAHAVHPLIPYLDVAWSIWEPACGNGNLVNELYKFVTECFGTDITVGCDFLIEDCGKDFDCIITNPPYSLKNEFLARCYKLGKPFALLLPLTTFETKRRQALFREHGVEVIFLPKRINFETPSGQGSGSWFATAWFTWGLNIGQQLTFSE
jgi:hypothetical protein